MSVPEITEQLDLMAEADYERTNAQSNWLKKKKEEDQKVERLALMRNKML